MKCCIYAKEIAQLKISAIEKVQSFMKKANFAKTTNDRFLEKANKRLKFVIKSNEWGQCNCKIVDNLKKELNPKKIFNNFFFFFRRKPRLILMYTYY